METIHTNTASNEFRSQIRLVLIGLGIIMATICFLTSIKDAKTAQGKAVAPARALVTVSFSKMKALASVTTVAYSNFISHLN